MLRRWDKQDLIEFTDIAPASFDPQPLGKELDELMRSIHGRDETGQWFMGPDVFRELYARVGFGGAVKFSRLPVVGHLVSLGYRIFAYFRYKAALRRMKKKSNCDGETCSPLGAKGTNSGDEKVLSGR